MNELQLQIEALKERIEPNYWRAIDVDEGWYQLVVDCHTELVAIDPHYGIFQVKEKFGGLRYYVKQSNPDDKDTFKRIQSIVAKYEAIAAVTCEATGKPGVLMKSIGGWRKTLNPEYAASTLHYGKYSIVNQPPSDAEWSEAIR
jgi:hypothetical protein